MNKSCHLPSHSNQLINNQLDYLNQPLSATGVSDRGFTGHKENRDIGLTFMNARYYSPNLGRFLSADTIVPDPGSSQAYNRYAYVENRPIVMTDPSGRCAEGYNEVDAFITMPDGSLKQSTISEEFKDHDCFDDIEDGDIALELVSLVSKAGSVLLHASRNADGLRYFGHVALSGEYFVAAKPVSGNSLLYLAIVADMATETVEARGELRSLNSFETHTMISPEVSSFMQDAARAELRHVVYSNALKGWSSVYFGPIPALTISAVEGIGESTTGIDPSETGGQVSAITQLAWDNPSIQNQQGQTVSARSVISDAIASQNWWDWNPWD